MKKTMLIFLLLALPAMLLVKSCTKAEGEVMLTYTKAIAQYGDLDSVRRLPLMVEQRAVENPIGFYVGKDFILVGERDKGIHIFNNLNMQSPTKHSFIQIPFNREFYVKGNYIYAESMYDFLKIDISDVYQPRLISRAEQVFSDPIYDDKGRVLLGFTYKTATDKYELNSPEAKEIRRQHLLHLDYSNTMIPLSSVPTMFTGNNGKSKGTMNRIAVARNHVYMITQRKMFILSDGSELKPVRTMDISAGSETIYEDDGKLFVGANSDMSVYEIRNQGTPSNPRRLGRLEHVTSCDPVLPVGKYAYYTLRTVANEGCNTMGENSLNVVDVSNPSNMRSVQEFAMKSPYGLALINQHLFVGEGDNGLAIFDAQTPHKLRQVKNHPQIKAFDILQSPFDNDIVITATRQGIKQFRVDWQQLQLSQIGELLY